MLPDFACYGDVAVARVHFDCLAFPACGEAFSFGGGAPDVQPVAAGGDFYIVAGVEFGDFCGGACECPVCLDAVV